MNELMKQKILAVNSVDYVDGFIESVVTTSHYGRVATRPYKFTLDQWGEIIERGCIE